MINRLPQRQYESTGQIMMEDLTYAYVAFSDNDADVVYVMACLDVLIENFDEFKTIHKMIPEMTMDYHNKFMIVNRMPKSMLSSFRTLVRMLAFNQRISVNADEQINFLLLLFRLGNMTQIKKFLELTDIRHDTWRSLMDVDIDVKDFFSEEQKYRICLMMKKNYPEMDEVSYLSFYNIPFTILTPDFTSELITKKSGRYGKPARTSGPSMNNDDIPNIRELAFPRKRIYDKASDSYYQCEIFGEKVLLLQPRKATIVQSSDKKSSQATMPALHEEYIFDKIIENFVYGDVVVAHRDKQITMQLVCSTNDGIRVMLRDRIYNDTAGFTFPMIDSHMSVGYSNMITAMIKNCVYIRPTQESMIAEFEKAKIEFASDRIRMDGRIC